LVPGPIFQLSDTVLGISGCPGIHHSKVSLNSARHQSAELS
jgi:hypothetical protein